MGRCALTPAIQPQKKTLSMSHQQSDAAFAQIVTMAFVAVDNNLLEYRIKNLQKTFIIKLCIEIRTKFYFADIRNPSMITTGEQGMALKSVQHSSMSYARYKELKRPQRSHSLLKKKNRITEY